MKRFIIYLLFAFSLTTSAYAGGVVTVQGSPNRYLFASRLEVSTTIQNQIAVTVVRQTFRNTTGAPARLDYFYPANINAVVTGFRWWQHGEMRVATITGTPQDTSVVGGESTPTASTLRAYLGSSPFIFPFKDSLRADSTLVVELTFMELLQYRGGQMFYQLQTDMRALGAPTCELQLHMALEADRDIVAMSSTSHPATIQQGLRSARADYSNATFSPTADFEIAYSLAQRALGVTTLSIKPAQEDGYFLMLAEPDPNTSQQTVIDKTFTFIIDVSGSMSGSKLTAAKEAARYTIEHLNADDRFNVIAFSSSATKFRDDPIAATPGNIAAARAFIDGLTPGGGTNLELPLLLGLGQTLPDTTANVIIFLTDGLASLDQEKIRSANTSNTRIFVFGIGTDVNAQILTLLAAGNNGLAEFLGTDDVSRRIPDFYNRIRNPLLQNISVTFNAGGVHDMYPLPLPDIYVGEQLVVLGRYAQPGAAIATVKGTASARPQEHLYDVVFSDDSSANVFIPKMWAKYKIDALLVLMQGVVRGSNQWNEYRAEIIRLGRQYGIITPFTSFTDPGSGSGGGNGGGTGGGAASGVEVEESAGIVAGALHIVCFPNPFTTAVTMKFTAPELSGRQRAVVEVYDATGRLVAVLLDAVVEPGDHTVEWDGRDRFGVSLASGTYMARIRVGDYTCAQRITLVR